MKIFKTEEIPDIKNIDELKEKIKNYPEDIQEMILDKNRLRKQCVFCMQITPSHTVINYKSPPTHYFQNCHFCEVPFGLTKQ